MSPTPKPSTTKRSEKPRVPVALTRTRLAFLYKLWAAGYDEGVYANPKEFHSGRELVRYGYADRNPSCPNHFRITQDGIDRLEAPMRLYTLARSHLKVVK